LQVLPSKPPHSPPGVLVPPPLPALPEGQSSGVAQLSPTTPELSQPLAAKASGDSAKIGKSQAGETSRPDSFDFS
jgi:hypothetical protein